jgi:hypothetical protein
MNRGSAAGVAVAALAILLTAECARQPSLDMPRQSIAAEQLPFEQPADKIGHSPTPRLPVVIPSGTWLHVRLKSPLSSATSQPGDLWTATLDRPIIVRDQVLAAAETKITGTVIAAKASDGAEDPGYMRVTLSEILLKGKPCVLKTSSVFLKGAQREVVPVEIARGTVGPAFIAAASDTERKGAGGASKPGSVLAGLGAGKRDVEFPADRQLSFRLTESIPLPD